MKKNVWIFNHYAEPPQYETRIRNNAMAKYLMREGYDVTIFAASTIHNTDINLITDGSPYIRREYDGLKFVHINVPKYSGNGLSRKINLLLFPYRLWKYTKRLGERPDVIVNDLTVMAMSFPFKIAKRYNVPIISEVRDPWPESIIESGLLKRESLLAKFLYVVERQIYQKSDAVVFTGEGGYDYIIEHGWEKAVPRSKVHYINNGVDMEQFDYNLEHFSVEDADLDNGEQFNVVYTGSIRLVNNLGLLVDAAKQVKDPKIKFLIWGDGDELPALRQRVEEEQIRNISFKGQVEKKYVPSIVSRADLNVVHWEMSNRLRFGVSFNKLFEYLAAGRPIFSTVRPGYSILEKYHCGMDTEGFTPEDLAEGIQRMAALPAEEQEQMGQNARKAAAAYDFKNLTRKLIDIIES